MNLVHKFRETCYAVLPICAIVLILGTTVAPLDHAILVSFAVGSVILIAGLTVFLTGADLGIVPAGTYIGAKLTRTRNITLILVSGLVIGFLITVAEPDLLVLGGQVAEVTGTISERALVLAVAAGVGLFVAVGLARVLLQIPYRAILIVGYAAVFALASTVSEEFVAISFDSGGATTGPMTVPFIIALGIGVAAVRGDKNALEDSFGYTGIASIGPILAVALLGVALGNGSGGHAAAQETANAANAIGGAVNAVAAGANGAIGTSGAAGSVALFSILSGIAHSVPEVARNVFVALSPLYGIILLFQLILLKLPPQQFKRVSLGFLYAYIGLILFFVGADSAFVPAGKALGVALGSLEYNWILIPHPHPHRVRPRRRRRLRGAGRVGAHRAGRGGIGRQHQETASPRRARHRGIGLHRALHVPRRLRLQCLVPTHPFLRGGDSPYLRDPEAIHRDRVRLRRRRVGPYGEYLHPLAHARRLGRLGGRSLAGRIRGHRDGRGDAARRDPDTRVALFA
jgi:hypothetical protein